MNEKTLVFDNGGAMDGNLVAALMNGNNRNNGYGNGYGWEWMWMILLWALWGGNGWGGFGGRGNGLSNLPAELNGDAGRQLLMNAIQGNGTAINQLASSLNCSVQQIQTALCNIQAQSGLSAQQIINAVQSGNAQVLSQMASCCCDVRTAIERQGYESQLATLNQTNTLTSNANTQFNALGSKIDAQTQVINDRFCALEMREMQNKLDAERAKSAALAGQLSQEHQTATIMQSQAKFGVLTNGINYQFYTDLDTPNKMDDKPFFEIDMLNLKDSHIEKLKQFRHDQYNTYMILNSATEMKYINALRSLIVKESSNPSDLFVKFMTKQVYDGVVTKNIIDEFRPMIQRAFQQYTNDYINERLKSAITPDVPSVEVSSNVSTEKSVANEEDMQDGNKIVTTDEELMGFYIVRAILCNTVDLDRVVDRDAQSYFAILFDDNNRKPICRLHFNGGKKYVETFDEEKKGTKHLITALTDIYKLSDQLISTVKFYLK